MIDWAAESDLNSMTAVLRWMDDRAGPPGRGTAAQPESIRIAPPGQLGPEFDDYWIPMNHRLGRGL